MTALAAPLVHRDKKVIKPRTWFGYLPLWQETVPLNPDGSIDTVRLAANILAGCIIGVRQTLSAIVSATLVFTSTSDSVITGMFPFGISMMWYSTMAGSAFYGLFGRLQYNTNATQEVCAILYGAMARSAAVRLAETPERIPPTVLALIVASTVLTGVCNVVFGKLGLGRFMLSFPTPVTSGFLGTIGFFLVKQGMEVTCGVPFEYFYPVSFSAFCEFRSLAPVSCVLAMVIFMRRGPAWLNKLCPGSKAVKMLGGLACQLLPLGLFYLATLALGVTLDDLSDGGWTYPRQISGGFSSLWTTYNLSDADVGTLMGSLPEMVSLVLMSSLCTMTGVLGITGKFPTGPDGDPAPDDVVDFDAEMTTVGVGSILVGLTNGVVTFHRLGSSVQLRLDGGTHRVAVMSSAAFVGIFFFSSVPLGHFIPKWFLGGLFLGSGVSFLEGVFLSYSAFPPSSLRLFGRQLPSMQYYVALLCILVAAFSTPFAGIGAGLAMSLLIFLWHSADTPPVSSMSNGRETVSRTMRPLWELRALRQEGDRILILYLQGQLFFGTVQGLATTIARTLEGEERLRYCVLSFAKVPVIDASAVEQLKGVQKKASRRGCKLVCCRMNARVFNALSAAQVIDSPDKDLRHVLGFDEVGASTEAPEQEEEHEHDIGLGPTMGSLRALQRVASFRAIGQGNHDAFDHETDALDFCGNQIIQEFCYGEGGPALEPYMLEYQTSCTLGLPLTEEAFEQINLLPAGTMRRLKPHCEVLQEVAPGESLPKTALYFVLKGAVSMVDRLPEKLGTTSIADVQISMKGFHGRGSKRLRKRYPPGSVVGKTSFFLQRSGRMLDDQLMSELIVSDKFARRTEVWVLDSDRWDALPVDIQRILSDMVLVQQADERQHTFLSGE